MSEPPDIAGPIRLGVSACILGDEVRYNGGHKLDRFIRDTLGRHVEFVKVCPEVELGLGVPRETLRLIGPEAGSSQLRMVAPKSGTEHTRGMLAWSRARVRELADAELSGYIVQKGSPSCGMERVKVYPALEGGSPTGAGRGLFTQVLMELLPHLPVEEDGRLNDPVLRDSFVVRVFAYRRVRSLFQGRWKLGDLVAFHAREKMLLLAHDRAAYTELGRLVAAAGGTPRAELAERYTAIFLDGLTRCATPRKHTNVLQHMAGHFKRLLSADDRAELGEVIESYRLGLVPLIVPITLLNHHIRRHQVEYLARQSYLAPHPRELMLRNQV